MASFASSATTCGARKHAWTNFHLCLLWFSIVFFCILPFRKVKIHFRQKCLPIFQIHLYSLVFNRSCRCREMMLTTPLATKPQASRKRCGTRQPGTKICNWSRRLAWATCGGGRKGSLDQPLVPELFTYFFLLLSFSFFLKRCCTRHSTVGTSNQLLYWCLFTSWTIYLDLLDDYSMYTNMRRQDVGSSF